MCGIVTYTGSDPAAPLLLKGLHSLEYRGYDSAGLALVDGSGGHGGEAGGSTARLAIIKHKGKVAELEQSFADATTRAPQLATTTCGIGHTRWATHGVPSLINAHPHVDCAGRIAVVHNGIIENHSKLREQLQTAGHKFITQTDTEVVAHLIEESLSALADPAAPTLTQLIEAVRATTTQLSGSFALGILHAALPGDIIVCRNDSPLVVGSYAGGALAASDTPAILEYTRDVVYLNDHDLAVLHADGSIDYYDPAGTAYTPTSVRIEWDIEDAQRGGYPDFMIKEIMEQPRAVADTIANRFDAQTGRLVFDELTLTPTQIAAIDSIYIVACGTSYHAGLIGKDLIEMWARIPVQVEVASEFRYRDPVIGKHTLVIAISQSGETADTLEAVKLAKRAGAHVLAITNVIGSRITLEAQSVLYIKARLEIAVAATKSFISQVSLLTLLALNFAQQRGELDATAVQSRYQSMLDLPQQIEQVLANAEQIEQLANACVPAQTQTVLFIGRGVGATTCYEGALKLKEISYVHAEAFSAGEIKHGSIALINPDGLEDAAQQTPVIAVALKSATYEKMLANIEEVLARGARVIALATEGDTRITALTDNIIWIPDLSECLSPIVASVPLQLFARAIALKRGADVDQPRNLAKSVTVE